MLEHIELKNFHAFGALRVDFSPKINIIIGENSTGKTHLLKAAYGLCSGPSLIKDKSSVDQKELEASLTTKFVQLYLPLEDKLGKMHRQGSAGQGSLHAQFAQDSKITTTFSNNSKNLAIHQIHNYEKYQAAPVFIPTKEVISFMKGFASLYQNFRLSFDQTYYDVCTLLDLPAVRLEAMHTKSTWAVDQIEAVCGGQFIFQGSGNVTFKTSDAEHSANSMAEGFRKAGMLSRLLQTGAIKPGVSGPLLWDEPETNLNPKLLKMLVEILLELSRNGQQIILATHDYVLLKWFDLLADKNKNDHVRFHTLRHSESDGVKVKSTDDYLETLPNPISETFNLLTQEQVNKTMGGLGK
jgi:AAA15 family ATPase/GTPase